MNYKEDIDNIKMKIDESWPIEGHLNKPQRDFLISIIKLLKPKNCLEIGFGSGRSALTTLLAANPKKFISIDIDFNCVPGSQKFSEFLMNKFESFFIIQGNSSDTLTQQFLSHEFKDGIDFVFIDGANTYKEVYNDISNTFKHLSEHGFMIVDDYESSGPEGCSIPDVDKAVNDFCKQNRISFNVWNKDGKGFAIIKR